MQALVQNKIDRQRVRFRESGRQTVRRLWWMVFGVETGRERLEEEDNQDRICWRAVFSVWSERAVEIAVGEVFLSS